MFIRSQPHERPTARREGQLQEGARAMNYIFVVEMLDHRTQNKWLPCNIAALSKAEAISEKNKRMQIANPDDKFRVSKYIRVERLK
jgi:hypothetical protein